MIHLVKKVAIKTMFYSLISFFISCSIHCSTRNPQFQKKCPVHNEKLIKTKIDNERGAWSSIKFDKNKTPFPKVGISIGCVGKQHTSIIKYCLKCGSGYNEF